MADHVSVRVCLRAVEGAELAIDVADVGVVNIPIDDVGDDLVALPVVSFRLGEFTPTMGQRAEFFEREGMKTTSFIGVYPGAIPDTLKQIID